MVLVVALGSVGCSGDSEDAPGENDAAPAPAVTTSASEAVEEAEPVITHRTVRSNQKIPFSSQIRKTAALDKGVRQLSQRGRAGVRTKVFRVTLEDGVESGRKLMRVVVARRPAPRITLLGTHVDPPKPVSSCDSNYAGCVPIASDVDCGGGSGDGPAYQYGSVQVVGSDVYDLDADGDGYGCD